LHPSLTLLSHATPCCLHHLWPHPSTRTPTPTPARPLHTRTRLTGGGPEFQPDWLDCCDKFALHAGGYAVLKGLQKGLRLPTDKMLPSFAGLQEYGNTSAWGAPLPPLLLLLLPLLPRDQQCVPSSACP